MTRDRSPLFEFLSPRRASVSRCLRPSPGHCPRPTGGRGQVARRTVPNPGQGRHAPKPKGGPALPALLCVLSCVSCSGDPKPSAVAAVRAEIANAMQRYMVAARAVNPDSIAAFYAPGAMLLEPGIATHHQRFHPGVHGFLPGGPGGFRVGDAGYDRGP